LVVAIENSNFEIQNLMREMVAMIAIYCADLDYQRGLVSLGRNSSFKLTAATLVLDKLVAKVGPGHKEVWRELYLLKPAWLAAQVAGSSQVANCPLLWHKILWNRHRLKMKLRD
jgi:hypothetical protein